MVGSLLSGDHCRLGDWCSVTTGIVGTFHALPAFEKDTPVLWSGVLGASMMGVYAAGSAASGGSGLPSTPSWPESTSAPDVGLSVLPLVIPVRACKYAFG